MRALAKGKLLTTEHVWFEEFNSIEELKKDNKSDVVYIHASKKELTHNSHLQYSLISKINGNMDMLFQSFNSTIKNEIRRANRENVKVSFFASNELKGNKVLKDFAIMYSEMYNSKGMDREVSMSEILAYIDNDSFLLSIAYIDNKPCVYHTYVYSEENARLLHSCSEFRNLDNAMRNMIGRSNKLLHFEDMKWLSNKGICNYDWGGISSKDNPNGIDKFKMGFNGTIIEYYNTEIRNSFKSKIIKALKI